MSIPPEVLTRVGIRLKPAEMEALLREVLARMPPVAEPPDEAELTAAERASLERAGFDLSEEPRAGDPLAQTAVEYAALLATAFTVHRAARRLRLSAGVVRQRLKQRQMYGIAVHGGWRLPRFQFDREDMIAGIEQVIERLDPHLHPVAVARWFTTPNLDLTVDDTAFSPRDWLRTRGDPSVVADLAAAL